MPLYEYRCRECGEKVTVHHGMDDPPPAACPVCGGAGPTRIVARINVVKSTQDRVRDLSWVDRNLARRIRKKVSGRVNPPLRDALDQMESK